MGSDAPTFNLKVFYVLVWFIFFIYSKCDIWFLISGVDYFKF